MPDVPAKLQDAPVLLVNIRLHYSNEDFEHRVLQPVTGLMLRLCPIRSFILAGEQLCRVLTHQMSGDSA